MEKSGVCSICGREYPAEKLTEMDGRLLCGSCLESETMVCEDCGVRIWNYDNYGDDDTVLCRDCYESDYYHCTECGRLINENCVCFYDDEPYCQDCYERRSDQIICEYDYKPCPIFYGEGPRFLGVELEIDKGGERDCSAEKIMDVANDGHEYIYCKHDGSLNDGFEIVTHPMSLCWHMSHMPWREVLESAVAMGYRSHQTDTCGLHVHVSRASFGTTSDEQEHAIARVLFFVERHWNELLSFSRRTQSQLQRWAARYGYKDHPTEMMEHAKKSAYNRYTCVNLTPMDTIEFRIFRGTLKYNTLIATLQLVSRICDVAVSLNDDELKDMSWSKFVSGITEPELIQYLKERRLYLNDPVESEVEV